MKIPVVDMGTLGVHHHEEHPEEEWKRVSKEISDAFRDIGFVYLINHGIPEQEVEAFMKASAEFFSLSDAKKAKHQRCSATSLQGYVAINREKLDPKKNIHEHRESYYLKNTNGILPDADVPSFRTTFKPFVESCRSLTNKVLVALALGLGLDRDFFISTHRYMTEESNTTMLRVNHYPPVPPDIAANAIRCGAHTDYGTITLLFQDDMGGLQVRERGGSWVDAVPVEGSVVVNVGDLLQFWTSDEFIATEHRVLIPEKETLQRSSRRSIAYFVQPDDPVLIKPLNGSASYEPVTSKEYLEKRYSETYQY